MNILSLIDRESELFTADISKYEKELSEILEKQKELITAKTESIRAAKRVDELYAEAITAMRAYSGDRGDDED